MNEIKIDPVVSITPTSTIDHIDLRIDVRQVPIDERISVAKFLERAYERLGIDLENVFFDVPSGRFHVKIEVRRET